VAFIITGRAIQTISSMMREKPETKAVKHPELLDLIFDPLSGSPAYSGIVAHCQKIW